MSEDCGLQLTAKNDDRVEWSCSVCGLAADLPRGQRPKCGHPEALREPEPPPVDRAEALRQLAASVQNMADMIGEQGIVIHNAIGLIAALRAALTKGVEMRAAQATYFKQRTRDNLIASKVAESDFDRMAREALALLPPEPPAEAMQPQADAPEAAPHG